MKLHKDFAQEYKLLGEWAAENDRYLFHIVAKHHMLWHMCLDSRHQNPRFVALSDPQAGNLSPGLGTTSPSSSKGSEGQERTRAWSKESLQESTKACWKRRDQGPQSGWNWCKQLLAMWTPCDKGDVSQTFVTKVAPSNNKGGVS